MTGGWSVSSTQMMSWTWSSLCLCCPRALALDLLMSFWVPKLLCMALGFMMTREQTAAGTPAPLFVRTGLDFPLGKLEVLQTEGIPAFHHWLPYTQGGDGQPCTIPSKMQGLM